MPKKSNKRTNKSSRKQKTRKQKTRKQKPIIMIGCSKKNKKSYKNNIFSSLGDKGCSKCGPNCHCGPNCKCSHPCPGNCYLNHRHKKQKGGSGCGSCGCPISPLSLDNKMNKFVGGNASYPNILKQPILIEPPLNNKNFIPTPGVIQNGGTCGQTPLVPQFGGNFFKEAAPIPGPKIGLAWEPNNLPGENGVGGDRNYFKPYNTNDNPQLRMTMDGAGYKTLNSMVGGYSTPTSSNLNSKHKRFKRSSSKRGGGLIPQDLVNLGRDFNYNFKSAYNALNGYKGPVSPLPYKNQLNGALTKGSFL